MTRSRGEAVVVTKSQRQEEADCWGGQKVRGNLPQSADEAIDRALGVQRHDVPDV